jgi:hypothetical protein
MYVAFGLYFFFFGWLEAVFPIDKNFMVDGGG